MASNIWVTCSFFPADESLYGLIISDIMKAYLILPKG
jgi:hypothetical protein